MQTIAPVKRRTFLKTAIFGGLATMAAPRLQGRVLAADRVAVELTGIDFAKVGYLNFCADAGLGEADLKKIEIIGEPIEKHRKTYKLADNIEKQLIWMKPPQVS